MAQALASRERKICRLVRGRHPHMDKYENNCDEDPRAVLLGATNSWFPITLSALAIPLTRDPIIQLVQDGWDNFVDVESLIEVKAILKVLVKNAILPGIDQYSPEEVWNIVEAIQKGEINDTVTQDDIKSPEWDVFIDPNPPTDWPHFLSEPSPVPPKYQTQIANVLLLKRLREVNALIGFTRVEAPEESNNPDEQPPMAALCSDLPDWIPASQVHGEGIFIRFDEALLKVWEKRQAVKLLSRQLFEGHKGWRNSRKLHPNDGFPGIRYVLLHTLSIS